MRKTVVLCDLDDDDPRPGVAVIEMAIDGVFRPLDVCDEHLRMLRALPRYEAAPAKPRAATTRAVGKGTARSTSATAAAPGSKRQPTSRRSRRATIAAARAWARSQGREVADLGRLPAGLLEEYEAATR